MTKAVSLGPKVAFALALGVLIVGVSARPASAGWRRRAVVVMSPAYGVPVETVYTAPVVTTVAPAVAAPAVVPTVATQTTVVPTTYVASPVVTTSYVAPAVLLPARVLRPRRVYIFP